MNNSQLNNHLLEAARNGDINILKYLVDHGADVNQADNYGFTPLILASRRGNLETIKYLVEHGANVNLADNAGDSPLIDASGYGRIDIVKYLIEHGANIEHSNNQGDTPLIWASRNGHLGIVKHLVNHGANVNHANNNDYTPLIVASRRSGHRLEMIKYLIDHGADYSSIKYTSIFRDIIKDQTNKLKNELTERYGLVKHIPNLNLPKDAMLKTIYEVPYQQYCVPYGEGLPPIQLIALANILNNTLPKKRGLIEYGGKYEPIDLDISWKDLCDKVKAALFLLL